MKKWFLIKATALYTVARTRGSYTLGETIIRTRARARNNLRTSTSTLAAIRLHEH